MRTLAACLSLLLVTAACGAPEAVPVEEVLKDLPRYARKRIVMRTRFKSGARCRQGEDGTWRTYCKDCQYCRGPIVATSERQNAPDCEKVCPPDV